MTEPSAPASSRWLKIVLGLSLAVNLFFLGLMGGKLIGGKEKDRRGEPPASFASTLSEERAQEVRAYFKAMEDDRRANRSKRREGWAKIREVMAAQPFDRAALDAAFDAMADDNDANRRARNQRIGDFVASLSDEERASFVRAMKERWERRRKRREQREQR